MSTIIYKNLKYARGFTLVEVIVVAVIVAVLATVAIPLYTNYVESSKKAIAENCAGSLASFISAGIAVGGIKKDDLKTEYKGDSTEIVIAKTGPNDSDPKTEFMIPLGVTCVVDWAEGYVQCYHGSKKDDLSKITKYRFKTE